jgi:hypothetical protein
MNALQCREWRIALLLVASGCAGSLDNAEDYQTVPLGDAGRVSTPQAGRAPASAGQGQGGWGGSKPIAGAGTGGAGGWSSPAGAGGKGGAVAAAGGGQGSVNNNTDEDAGVPDSGSGSTQMPPPQQMACDFRGIMQAKCGNATCHGAPGSSTGLDLTSAMLAARVEGRQGKGACSDKLLVDPENPRDSKLYLKVSGSTCGSQMPLGGQLNADEQACVLSWIEGL